MSGLTGMKAICEYMNRSEVTVLGLIRDCDMPACRINGGIWEADTDLIDTWRKEQITQGMGEKKQPEKKTKKKRRTKA